MEGIPRELKFPGDIFIHPPCSKPGLNAPGLHIDTLFSLLYIGRILFGGAPSGLIFRSGGILKEVVRKIIDTEHEFRESVEQAREKARKIVRDAEDRGRELVEESRRRALKEAQELIARLKSEAEDEKERRVGQVEGGGAELLSKKGKEIGRAVERITELVTGGIKV
jgi:vacuolar-type H+-ATPase subunit H